MQSRTRSSRKATIIAIGATAISGIVAGVVWWWLPSQLKELSTGEVSVRHEAFERPSHPSDDYVGGSACRRCHQAIWDRYQSHPMSQSAEPIATLAASATASTDAATPLEDFDRRPSFAVSTPIGEMVYRVEQSPDGQFHHESLTDPVLGSIYDQREKVDYAIGSGRHGRSYILVKNDCLFMSPITWYSEVAKWDLSPNYRPGNHQRFERRILQGCLVCHTDRVSVNRDEPHRFPTLAILEAKISCERCHGPGVDHIAFQDRRSQAAEPVTAGVDPIVNPMKLDRERRESVCWQCHFGAEERIPRYGRLDSDFRPGMNFDDIWVAFVRSTRFDEKGLTRVASHVEQSRASVCSQRSEGRFGCTSCHDPHFAPSEREKVGFYRERCLTCHADRGCALSVAERTGVTESDSCVACHMPPRGLNGVPHTSRTDHRVLRRPQRDNESADDLPFTIFNPSGRALPQVEQDRAWGIFLAKLAFLQSSAEIARAAEQKLTAAQPFVLDDMQVLEWLGVCEQILGRRDSARDRWREILKQLPQHEAALRRLADLAIEESDLPAARDALALYLDVNPWQSKYQIRLAAISGDLGNLEAVVRFAQESLRIDPSAAASHKILFEAYTRQKRQTDAELQLKLYQRLSPKN